MLVSADLPRRFSGTRRAFAGGQAPGPFGLRGNRREKLAQNLLRGDERRSG